jgi:hypothetical protein
VHGYWEIVRALMSDMTDEDRHARRAASLTMGQGRWGELSQRARRLIVIWGVFEGLLIAPALVDLARRPANEIRGSKHGWATATVLVKSADAVPIACFARGNDGPERGRRCISCTLAPPANRS